MINHTLDYCDGCGYMIRCWSCNNNSCNGSYGNKDKCPDCPSAYRLQDLFWRKCKEANLDYSSNNQYGRISQREIFQKVFDQLLPVFERMMKLKAFW
jgi:hypothetical protein